MICGLGTGRCGTHSLAAVLKAAGLDAVHERKPPLSWAGDEKPDRHFNGQDEPFADVGFYYLNYVTELLKNYPMLRFVCMKRDIDLTVRSFMRVRPAGTHWFMTNPPRRTFWDRCFPNYDCEFAEAVRRYWHDYYATAEDLQCERFLIFPTEGLNSDDEMRRLFEFAEIDHEPITNVCLTMA